MKFAIPLAEGKLTAHFGHCREFAFVDVEDDKIKNRETLVPPPHEPGVLPQWLHEQAVHVIIAGGMGGHAQRLFAANGITVVLGASGETPEQVATAYLSGTLEVGDNICEH